MFGLGGAEIRYFNMIILDEYVGGLNISMEDVLFVHKLDAPDYL